MVPLQLGTAAPRERVRGTCPRRVEEKGPHEARSALCSRPLVRFQAFLKTRHCPEAYYEIPRPRHAARALAALQKGAEGPGGREIPDYSRKRTETSPKCLPPSQEGKGGPPASLPAPSQKWVSDTAPLTRGAPRAPGHPPGVFFWGGPPCPLPSAPHVSCRSAPAPLRGGQFLLGFLPGIAPVPAGWNGNTRSGLSPALYQEKQRRKKSHILLSRSFPCT